MPLFTPVSTTKYRNLRDIYSILSRIKSSSLSGSTQQSSKYIITDIGGFGFEVYNDAGIILKAGYLLKPSNNSSTNSVILANENDFNVLGPVYKDIHPYKSGYVVSFGPADVFVNANGSFAGGYVQMSRGDSTGNDDAGKAHCGNVNEPDAIAVLGYVFQTRTGEGLARCFIKR